MYRSVDTVLILEISKVAASAPYIDFYYTTDTQQKKKFIYINNLKNKTGKKI